MNSLNDLFEEKILDVDESEESVAPVRYDISSYGADYTVDSIVKLLPSGDGYFAFNDNYNMYIEIMSFDKILNDSRERNRVLFEKLNLT